MKPLSTLSFALIILAGGCKPADEDELVESERPPVAFEGTADAQFVGKWKSADGKLAYTFSKDGRFESETNVVNHGSPLSMKSGGEWKINGAQMIFRDKTGAVVPYDSQLKGNTLTLTTVGSLKNKLVLKKG